MVRLWTAFVLVAKCLAMQVDPVTLQAGQVDPVTLQAGLNQAEMATEMEMEIVAGQMAECATLSSTPGFRPWNKGMERLRESKMWGLKEPQHDRPYRPDAVMMAFLIFAEDRLENEDIWLHWMGRAREAGLEFTVLISNQSEWQGDALREHVVSSSAPTSYCRQWDTQMSLIRTALQDWRVTHLVTLSSDSVPVKPMAWIYNQVHNDPLSRFCADDYWRDPWPRAEMWSVLRRDDATFFDKNSDFAEKNFRRGCEDQVAWYFPLRVRWDNFNSRAPLKRECIMFANWKDGRNTCQGEWAKSVDRYNFRQLRRRRGNHTPADYRSPVVYHDVNEQALEELVRSPFWFARRFTEGAVPQKLKSVLEINLSKPTGFRSRFGHRLFR